MRKDYLAFFLSLFLSRLGDQVLLFIVPLIVFQSTGSAAWAGLAFFVESLPRFLAFPVCGALCDRLSPVRLLHISQAWRALVCLAAVGLHLVFDSIAWLVALSALCGVLTTQGIMAREVLMPNIFAQYSYTRTLSYSQIADQSGLVLGPVLAALLLEAWAWHWVVLASAGVFLLADLAMIAWQRWSAIEVRVPAQHAGLARSLGIAMGHIRAQAPLKKIITLAVGVNLIVGVTLATSAALVIGEHGADKDAYAALQVAGALTTIAILFFLARVSLPLGLMGVVGYLMIASGAFASAWSPGLAGYVVGFLLIVGFDKMFNVYMRNVRQQVIPPADFGKTVGVITLLNNLSQPLAGMLVAALAAPLGVRGVILLLAGLTVALGALAVWLYPQRRAGLATQPGEG
ncbi:MFS transporter [Pseudomonas entomophila]|uniref:MFS transporter n=1 Tax=Pseudomonas entomophila TaxID=312306 RepID=UPI0023D7E804|nr:MFS transporter [Pseudomonas entomophila]MDF0729302.1 MFS transporter [Pseudomonas entomophila]